MRDGYAVQVLHHSEPILTIERTMLSGKAELSDEDKAAIDEAGEHLIAFAGVHLPSSTFLPEPLDAVRPKVHFEEVRGILKQTD